MKMPFCFKLGLVSVSLLISHVSVAQFTTEKSNILDVRLAPVVSDLSRFYLESDTCEARVKQTLRKLKALSPQGIPLSNYSGAREKWVKSIFFARLNLRNQLQQLARSGQIDESCARAVQRVMRYYRGLEDYIGYNDPPKLDPNAKKLYGGIIPRLGSMLNPGQNFSTIQSGDVLLSRGNAATSSAIARLADEDTQFSHMALVYIHPITKKAFTIESHIELGVVIEPIEKWLTDGKKRTVVYRHHDSELAARAAVEMVMGLRQYQKAHHATVPYDFGFNMNDHSEIFCSEVVRVAFQKASQGSELIPFYPSRLTQNLIFLEQLGVKESVSFIPADIEIDPRFDLVLEWRNFQEIKESWTRDAISSKIFSWMERDGVKLNASPGNQLLGQVAVHARKLGIAKKKVAPNADASAITLMLTIESFYDQIEKKLEKREDRMILRRGTPFTLFEIDAELERMRIKDPTWFRRVLR